MKYPPLPFAVVSLVLALLCVALPLNTERIVLIFLVAGFGGALCAYLYAARVPAISLEKSTLIGASAGVIGGLLGFIASVLAVWKSCNAEVIFNLRSLNLAVVGVIELALASGVGGLTVGLLSRIRARRAAVK